MGEDGVIGSLMGVLTLGFVLNGLDVMNVSAFLLEIFSGLLVLFVGSLNQFRRWVASSRFPAGRKA